MKWRIPVSASVLDLFVGAYLYAAIGKVIIPELLSISSPWSSIDTILTIVLALFAVVVGAVAEISLGAFFIRGALPTEDRPTGRLWTQHLGWLTFSVSVLAGWILTEISPIEFFSGNGLKGAGRIFGALLTPNFDIIGEALDAMVVTIFTAFMSTIIAVPLAFLLAFPAARNVMNQGPMERSIYSGLRAILNITRSMEPIIWAIIFSVWVGIGPFAGMLALVVTKGWKSCSSTSAASPGPVSATMRRTSPGPAASDLIKRSRRSPPAMASMALRTRFRMTCWIWTLSTRTRSSPGSRRT